MTSLKPLSILIGTLAFWFVGWAWYGLVFQEPWMAAHGLTEEDAAPGAYMAGGVIITIMQVIGVGLVLKWRRAASIPDALKTTFLLWLTIALPGMASAFVYLPAHDLTLLAIDAGYVLVGWLLVALSYAVLR